MRTENSFGIESQSDIIHEQDKEVNKVSEYNLLHYMINPPKHAKYLNNHYSNMTH